MPALRCLTSFLAVIVASGCLQGQNPARPVMDEMIHQLGNVLSVSARVKRTERLADGTFVSGEMEFKVMYEPRLKAYVRLNHPNPGTEVLYVEGWNGNAAFVNPNRFPWINVNLDPCGSHMLNQQHHSLLCIGFRYTRGVLHYMYNNIQDFDRQVTYLGVQQWSGRTTHLLKVSFPDYGSKAYRIQGDENLCEVEQKIFVPAAKMLELNPEVDDYWDRPERQQALDWFEG
ncbi:MAG: hypothetical protein RLZZ165_1801 [Bacteroidota bacterium]